MLLTGPRLHSVRERFQGLLEGDGVQTNPTPRWQLVPEHPARLCLYGCGGRVCNSTSTCAHTDMRTHRHAHTVTHAHAHTHAHTRTRAHAHTRTHAHTHTLTHARMRTHTGAHTHTHSHTHTRTRTRTRTHAEGSTPRVGSHVSGPGTTRTASSGGAVPSLINPGGATPQNSA